ncbi:MAG: hypothetical protein G3M78_07625 [Candidatus Nitrohelix vancouverensis]|uniref:Uncharacterized protein n=1 Tax=Candidatus Nitrohelix vancouverensis TaxID=2705534 RepID=A0A7T0C2B7_9BACT|nr:MAG: hypothetical protein G3M78_07625 [Candidatus Nitrohelix vancouverensis]
MRLFVSLLLILCLVSPAKAQAPSLSLIEEKDGVRLEAQQVPMLDILGEIQRQSGIRFDIPKGMVFPRLSLNMKKANWRELVSTLLRDFNKIEVWSNEAGKSYVKIMGNGGDAPSPVPQKQARTKQATPPQSTQDERPQHATPVREEKNQTEQAKTETGHPLALLPTHILLEPAILDYLLKNNVDFPLELKKKYGIKDSDKDDQPKRIYPIPHDIYNHPDFEQYLLTVGLPKPPQIPVGFKKIDRSQK